MRHEDWSAALGAHRELGTEYDQAFVESFVERIAAEIDARVEMRVVEVTTSGRSNVRRRGGTFLALSSMVLGIPLTAIAGAFGHTAGIAVVWGGVVIVNVANAIRPSWSRSQIRRYSR